MAKDTKKSKAPKGKKAYQQGYVSFTPEDLQEQARKDPANAAAYDLLDQAMTTSSHITAEDKHNFDNGGTVDIDDVYPVSAEETEEMDHLLNEAEKRAGNPNEPFFRDRLNELRNIVGWSKERHWNFSWMIILGAVIFVGFLFYMAADSNDGVVRGQRRVDMVKSWTEMDTTLVLSETEYVSMDNDQIYANANNYKLYKCSRLADTHKHNLKEAERFRAMADTATVKENRKRWISMAKDYDKKAEQALDEFNDYNKMKFKQVKKTALGVAKATLAEDKSTKRWAWAVTFFFMFLIPLYIYADRPYGWMESRHRTEAKVLGGIRKWAFAIAGGLAGGALAMDFLPDTIVKWSDGSTTREGDPTNIIIIGMKIFMYIAAIVILAVVSTVIMLYATIQGLRRNYDWTPVKLRLKAMFGKAKAAAEDAIAKK